MKVPLRKLLAVGKDERYCWTWPLLKLKISRSFGRLLLLLVLLVWCTASDQCFEEDEVMVMLPELLDPKLLLSERDEPEASLDTDCFILRF